MAAPEEEVILRPEEWGEETETPAERDLSIGRRIGNWKSLLSFAFAGVVLALVIIKGGIDPQALWQRLSHMDLAVFGLAFVVYYATFPLRGYRWKVLLQNSAGEERRAVDEMSLPGLTEILYISWFVNCVVPAKLGDLYRAYLAKLWARISWTRTIGTIMAERVVDLLVLSLLLSATGIIVFRNRLGHVSLILLIGVGLAVVGVVTLVLMKTFSARIRARIPAQYHARYVAFEEGTLQSFRRLPLLLGITGLVWLMEGTRLQLVYNSLGFHLHLASVPFAPMLFLALGTAVLTTIPFTPGGLGLVELGVGGLMIFLGIPKVDAAAIVLADRLLSYYSIAFFGFLVYLFSKRSHFRQHA